MRMWQSTFYLLISLIRYLSSRRSDLLNERLPQFDANFPNQRPAIFPTPSMRSTLRWGNGPSDHIHSESSGSPSMSDAPPGGANMEYLNQKSLEEEEFARENGEESTFDNLADRIARDRLMGRPGMLKRYDTA